MLSKDNLSQLLKTYKDQKKDENLFIDTQSIHWENYFKENEKFISIEPNKDSLNVDFQLVYSNNVIGKQRNKINFSDQLTLLKKRNF